MGNSELGRRRILFKRIFTLFLVLSVFYGLLSCAFHNGYGFSNILTAPESVYLPSPEVSGVAETPDAPTADVAAPERPVGYTGPDLAAAAPADDEFFSDAAFMGNSLMDGFRMFSGITACDYYAATSLTVFGAVNTENMQLEDGSVGTAVGGLTQKPYGKIYILLGINEIGMNVDTFIADYSAMLDIIIAAQPECDIYIMGITPVSLDKSNSSDVFSMERIRQFNEALYLLAAEKECYYLDLVTALADETGYLPSNETTDGVHFTAYLYGVWADFVREHYV